MSTVLAILQTVRLKGRTTSGAVAAATGLLEREAQAGLSELVRAGSCDETKCRYQITKAGREYLNGLLEQERASIARERIKELHEEFSDHNGAFKKLVTDWQMKDSGTPNDHGDATYDRAIIERLGDLHEAFSPLLATLVAEAPRLKPYPSRFEDALEKVYAGDHSWLASPIKDSYHTVWFELHEEFLGLANLSRVAEAAAGRAE